MMKQAACALILNEEGKVLAISRRNKPTDMNLPGGKVDPGETPEQACIREAFEETNLVISDLELVYRAPCVGGDTNYDTFTYMAKTVTGNVQAKEEGFVARWVDWDEICGDNSFTVYNQCVRAWVEKQPITDYKLVFKARNTLLARDKQEEREYLRYAKECGAKFLLIFVYAKAEIDPISQAPKIGVLPTFVWDEDPRVVLRRTHDWSFLLCAYCVSFDHEMQLGEERPIHLDTEITISATLSPKQTERFIQWDIDVMKKIHERRKQKNIRGAIHGAIGGGFTWSITSTTLGQVVTCKESITGEEINLTDYEDW